MVWRCQTGSLADRAELGARGTGKTTYIREAFTPDVSLYLDLLDPDVEDLYRRTPSRLEQQVRALPGSVEWILIDEVQRAPRLLDVTHRLMESTDKRFVLTGSSGRKLRRGASNLLAGRAFVHNLYPFTVPELHDAFDLNAALRWGTLPRIYALDAGTYEYGKAFEHFVVTQIVHLSQYRYPDWRFSYLQTGAGVEIHLVVERPGLPTALIEIKSSGRVDERDVRNLARFTGDFPEPLALCISRDPTRMQIDGILCVHWRDALSELRLS